MRTTLLLLLLGTAADSSFAQTPVPPTPPVPARKPVKPVEPAIPVPPREFLLAPGDWHFDFPSSWPKPLHFDLPLEWSKPMQFELPLEPFHWTPSPELSWPMPPVPEFDFQWTPQAPAAPLHEFELWGERTGTTPRGKLLGLMPEQGTAEDSLFRAARQTLNRGEYVRAAGMFDSFVSRYPRSRVAPAAYYYSAFALYRSGSSSELQSALAKLRAQQERYPEAADDPDTKTLRTRVYAALAARGDAQAAAELKAVSAQGGAGCDRDEMEVRAEALNALSQLNTPEARPTLKKVLARRDECSVTLRRRAVYILGRSGTDEAVADLLDAAKNDPDPGVRSDAVMMIGRSSGASTMRILEQIFNESTDERVRAAALSAIRSRGGPEAKRLLRTVIERGDLSERARIEAIQQLGRHSDTYVELASGKRVPTQETATAQEEDAAFLRSYYAKSDSRNIKLAILSAVGRIGGNANQQWLLTLAKNPQEETSLRRAALSRIQTTSLSTEELFRLFESLSERELRSAVVSQLGSRDDPAAVDKLIEIAKSTTLDPQLRRQAISALSKKNDPRTTKLLLELVEKP